MLPFLSPRILALHLGSGTQTTHNSQRMAAPLRALNLEIIIVDHITGDLTTRSVLVEQGRAAFCSW